MHRCSKADQNVSQQLHVTSTVYNNCNSLADDVRGIGPCTERLLELPMSVVISSKVSVRVDMHVGVVTLSCVHCLHIKTDGCRSAWRSPQLFHVTNATHRYWIPASHASANFSVILLTNEIFFLEIYSKFRPYQSQSSDQSFICS